MADSIRLAGPCPAAAISQRSGVARRMCAIAAVVLVVPGCSKRPAPVAAQAPEVYVAPVVQQDVPIYIQLVGQTQGFQDVEIRARVEGFLQTVNFPEGSFVHKGQLLYQIDPKSFEATLLAAKANVATA